MIDESGTRDLASLVVARIGRLEESGDPWEPYRLLDHAGRPVAPAAAFLGELQAAGRTAATQRSYGMDLLRWFRFVWAVDVPWDKATRVEARDYCRWIQVGRKPATTHWRRSAAPGSPVPVSALSRGTPNRVTGRSAPGPTYAPATAAHGESVLRGFYEFHAEAGSGPMVNPFPLARRRQHGRADAHHNPMEPHRRERVGRYRPKLPRRLPRRIPDGAFNELFAGLGSHRDRALVAFWVSTGARASELLGARIGDLDAGQQLVTVIRKGSRAMQQIPASPDAFVWHRLYQAEVHGKVPAGFDDPLWWTLRSPFRPLTYHAAYRMFVRTNQALDMNWTLHDLRHTAAYRMARDPELPLTDVQWILGHAHLTTTQIYMSAPADEAIASILAHHVRRSQQPAMPPLQAPGYRSESLNVLFGEDGW
ncbi:site-specific integrase [Micromonospora sp. NPDC005324]|uniref:tyrosine-type recombinase/integrase n=1 Tax=Micromonospora sp. NPDC005324 TaxID=3157033 RepID=UPI0033AF2689